jgi:hypothetical protein
MAGQSEIADPISATIQSWADRELAPWRTRNLVRTQLERQLYNVCRRAPSLRLYRFAAGTVALLPRAEHGPPHAGQEDRARHYLNFFRDVASQLPRDFNAMICISLHDKVLGPKLPLFGLQRSADETWLLMPDIDFLINRFYEEAQFKDTLPYGGKVPRAVFAGATSGGIHTVERILSAATPRLRAAAFFDGRLDVDFRLPNIVQCADDEARALLEAQPYCQRPVLQWQEQFHSRFLISMDGNGATCSRVAVALASNGVLLKYHSEDMLYYFDGLMPHVHYVPIARDQDVLDVLAAERREPGRYLPVADAGRSFASQYLTRERVTEYMVRLLLGYAAMLAEGDAAQPRTLPRRVVAVARAADGVSHLSETHEWVGLPGSFVALTSFKLLCQPRTEVPRLYYQASTEGGGFTPTTGEGAWCGEDGALTGIRLLNPRDAGALTIAIEARFVDGTEAFVAEMGVECRAESGAAIEAFRVRLA